MRLTTRGLLVYILVTAILLASARRWWIAFIVDVLFFASIRWGLSFPRQLASLGASLGVLLGLLGCAWWADIHFSADYAARGAFVVWAMPIACQIGLLSGIALGYILAGMTSRFRHRGSS